METINNKKYTIATFGCQMNEHDSERIAAILENMGYTQTDNYDNSDFIIFNTCLVRENAELKVYGQIGALKKWKREHPDALLAICGCMMQTGEARDVILKKHPQVDIIFGTSNINSLPELMDTHKRTGKTAMDISRTDSIDDQFDMIRSHPSIGYVNIMTGCNNFCSYCIVPYARGREESRSPESIIKEVQFMAKEDYKEITLLGQNVNSYGKDKDSTVSFPELLEEINKIEGIERIRFLTSHPKDLSDELIEKMATLDKVCENLHLPFQSGSNAVLKAMNRKYTREDYLKLIKKLKDRIPGISLSTDIIVGFPGETEEDFQDTLDLVKEVEYEQGFTFLYSIRPGTRAAEMKNQIPDDVKQDRFQRLLDTMYPIFFEKNKEYLDTIQEVMVEGTSKNDPSILAGRTRTFKLVHFKGDENLIGKLVNVHITENNSFALKGEMVN